MRPPVRGSPRSTRPMLKRSGEHGRGLSSRGHDDFLELRFGDRGWRDRDCADREAARARRPRAGLRLRSHRTAGLRRLPPPGTDYPRRTRARQHGSAVCYHRGHSRSGPEGCHLPVVCRFAAASCTRPRRVRRSRCSRVGHADGGVRGRRGGIAADQVASAPSATPPRAPAHRPGAERRRRARRGARRRHPRARGNCTCRSMRLPAPAWARSSAVSMRQG